MSMIPGIDDERFSQGMSTERFHPWHGEHLAPQPVSGVEGIAGAVALISLHGPHGGMTYEQCEPIGESWHRAASSGAVPNMVRPA